MGAPGAAEKADDLLDAIQMRRLVTEAMAALPEPIADSGFDDKQQKLLVEEAMDQQASVLKLTQRELEQVRVARDRLSSSNAGLAGRMSAGAGVGGRAGVAARVRVPRTKAMRPVRPARNCPVVSAARNGGGSTTIASRR